MNILSVTSLFTHSLVWALLYSLWQGMIVYGCLYLLLKIAGNISSGIRYYLSLGAFTSLFTWFAATWADQYQKLKGITVYVTQPGINAASPITYSARTVVSDPVSFDMFRHSFSGVEQYSSIIVILYFIGLGLMFLRFLINWLQLHELRTNGVVSPDEHLNELTLYWSEQLNISFPVRLLMSSRIDVPMMLGTFRPVILIPVAAMSQLSLDQVEAILLHELAHIKRQDYLVNILQTIAETVLFFNPFVWLLSSAIRQEREHCCDDLVVAHTANPMPYARALAMLECERSGNQLSLAITGNKNQLFNRIKRIMEMKKQNINYSQLSIIILAIIAITFSVAAYTPSFAQKSKKDKGADTAKKQSTYVYKTVTIDSNGNKKVTSKTTHEPVKEEDDDVHVNVSINGDDYSKDVKKIVNDIVKASRDAAMAMTDIDKHKLEIEIEKAEKEIDLVDWEGIKVEINKSIKEVDDEINDPKLRKEIKIEIKKNLEQAKEELENVSREMKHKNVAIAIAGDGDNQYRPNANDFDAMLDKMESEHLIDRSRSFKIKKENDELYINGEKQSNSVYDNYKRYLHGKTVIIKGKKGDLSISIDN